MPWDIAGTDGSIYIPGTGVHKVMVDRAFARGNHGSQELSPKVRAGPMGGFIDDTNGDSSPSERACGAALATLLPTKAVVILQRPSGHRAAVGGNRKSAQEIREDENYSGTVNAYTAVTGGDSAAKMVSDKLGTQARAVIVDLSNLRNEQTQTTTISKIIRKVNDERPGGMVIFLFAGRTRIHNQVDPFRGSTDTFT